MRSADEPLHLELVNVSRRRLPVSAVSLTSLLLLNSSCFPGWVPDSLDSGLTEKSGQLRTIDDVVSAIIRLSIHEEAANSATHLALHVPVYFLPDPEGARESSSAGTLAYASLSV